MFVPAIAQGTYNYLRWNTITGHGPAHTSLTHNFYDLWITLTETCGWGGLVMWAVLISSGIWIVSQKSDTPLNHPLIAALAYGLAYFACLAMAASTARVDQLDRRLVAPGFGPCILGAGMATGVLFASAAFRDKTRILLGGLLMMAFISVAAPSIAATAQSLYGKLTHREASVAAYNSGFLRGKAHHELSHFYREELTGHACVSVTMLNAESPAGRVRRDYFAIAEALASSPVPRNVRATLVDATRDQITIHVSSSNANGRLVFLPSRIPEMRVVRAPTPKQRSAELLARTQTLMTRVSEQAERYGCARHWVVIPQAAKWFRAGVGESYARRQLKAVRDIGPYKSFLLEPAS
jgi:hypothetical protein